MSPVDTVSPISPINLSPVTSQAIPQCSALPATPVLSPALHLPKLITSFQRSSMDANVVAALSAQFQLPTPSPLKLDKTPSTAVCHREISLSSRETNVTDSPEVLAPTPSQAYQALRLTLNHPNFPDHDDVHPVSSSTLPRVPSLQRQNAMEGLETLATETGNQTGETSVKLPLRVITSRSFTAPQTCTVTQRASLNTSCTESHIAHPAEFRSILPKSQPTKTKANLGTTTSDKRIRPRSPIRKSNHKRSLGQRASIKTSTTVEQPKGTIMNSHDLLKASISHLSYSLQPLISIRTGHPHPEFPKTLLQYHLLTHDQLDRLARHYHQTLDAGRERWSYPCPIGLGKVWCGAGSSEPGHDPNFEERKYLVDLATKQRRWGRFIGLRGCESPVDEATECQASGPEETAEALAERLDREWRDGLRRREDERKVQEKIWGRMF